MIATGVEGSPPKYRDVNEHHNHALVSFRGRLIIKVAASTSIGAAFRQAAGPLIKKHLQVSNMADQLDGLLALASTDLRAVTNRFAEQAEPLGASVEFGHAKLHLVYIPHQSCKDWDTVSFPKALGDLTRGAPYLVEPLRDLWHPRRVPLSLANKIDDQPKADVFAKAQEATMDAKIQLGKLIEALHVVNLPDGSMALLHSAETFNSDARRAPRVHAGARADDDDR